MRAPAFVLRTALAALLPLTLACTLAACASGTGSGPGSTAASAAPPQRRTVAVAGANLVMATEATTDVTALPHPVARAWEALAAVYDSLGIPVGTRDPRGYVVGNTGYKVRQRLGRTPLSRYLDCGGSTQVGPNADSYDVILSVISELRPVDATSTRLATTVEAQARPATFNQAWSRCTSKGSLETRIADLVQGQLAR